MENVGNASVLIFLLIDFPIGMSTPSYINTIAKEKLTKTFKMIFFPPLNLARVYKSRLLEFYGLKYCYGNTFLTYKLKFLKILLFYWM